MTRSVQFLQAVLSDMGVNFSGRYICMTEHNLDRAKIGTVLDQMSCKGVPKRVRRDLLAYCGTPGGFFDDFPESLTGHGLA